MNMWQAWQRGRAGAGFCAGSWAGGRGFTMIEILVVIIILGIAAAVAVPMMSNYDNLRIPAAARMTVADLSYAQNEATTRMTSIYVLFTKDAGGTITGYQVATKASPTVTADYLTRPGDGGPMKATFGSAPGATGPLLYSRIGAVTVGNAATVGLGFNAQGQPLYKDSSGSFVPLTAAGTVRITNAKGTITQDVTIQPVTGLVSTPQ